MNNEKLRPYNFYHKITKEDLPCQNELTPPPNGIA